MTELHRVRTHFFDFQGGPGICTMYALDVDTFLTDLSTMWSAFVGYMPTGLNVAVEASGDLIEDTTGEITGAWTSDPATLRTGTRDGVYSAPAGGCINWLTSTIVDGRRLRGRTFVVPLGFNTTDASGQLASAVHTTLVNASTDFKNAQDASFVVWHRPVEAKAATAHSEEVVARAGGHGLVTGVKVMPGVAVLRSRRD